MEETKPAFERQEVEAILNDLDREAILVLRTVAGHRENELIAREGEEILGIDRQKVRRRFEWLEHHELLEIDELKNTHYPRAPFIAKITKRGQEWVEQEYGNLQPVETISDEIVELRGRLSLVEGSLDSVESNTTHDSDDDLETRVVRLEKTLDAVVTYFESNNLKLSEYQE